MRSRWIGLTGAGLLLAALVLALLPGQGLFARGAAQGIPGQGMMGQAMSGGMMGYQRPATGPYDQRFLDAMIMHHQGGVMMTQYLIADSERPELQKLAEDIISAQQREIAQMQQWRRDWYGTSTGDDMMGGGMMSGGMMDRAQMGQMMGSTFDADRHFLEMMIPHHEAAISMAQEALETAERPEIKTLAQQIITTQRAEIEEMQGYLQQWFGASN